MAFDAVVKVRHDFLTVANARFHRGPSETDHEFVERHLSHVTGIPNVRASSGRYAAFRNGTVLIIRHGFPLENDTDLRVEWVVPWNIESEVARSRVDNLHDQVVRAAAWLRASPRNRVIQFMHCNEAIVVTLLLIYLDILDHREAPAATSVVVSPPLLDAVLSTLHGRDRRTAAQVCRQWRRAACDAMLPLTNDDVRAWVAPRLTEVKEASSVVIFSKEGVEVIWGLTRHWLGGGV
jgi:hypothetical protein